VLAAAAARGWDFVPACGLRASLMHTIQKKTPLRH
jgi:hypothetical protein